MAESKNTMQTPGNGSLEKVFTPERLYGIIGQPLDHSLSPLIHNWGFKRMGLDAAYLRWPIASSSLEHIVLALKVLPISGLSVTIPHKQSIIPLLDGCTENAFLAGAVNTVFWDGDQVWGENTDIQGFLSPFPAGEWGRLKSVLVLGNGGAARGVLVGLASMGVKNVVVSGRNSQHSMSLAAGFDVEHLEWDKRGSWCGDLLINTTPLGMAGHYAGLNPWPSQSLKGVCRVYDLIYNPLVTPLLKAAKESNRSTISGLQMFLGQAIAQFALWTGKTLPFLELQYLVMQRLARD